MKTAFSIFLFTIFKSGASNKGLITEVLEDKKYDCPVKGKKLFSVKSEIQCTHRCLKSDECQMINYNTEKESKENCEIITNLSKCTTKTGMRGWRAMLLQVVLLTSHFDQVNRINSLLRFSDLFYPFLRILLI